MEDKWPTSPLLEHGLRILAGYLKLLLPPPIPVPDTGPIAPGMLGKHPPLVGKSG